MSIFGVARQERCRSPQRRKLVATWSLRCHCRLSVAMAPVFSKPFPPEFLPSHDLDLLPDPPGSCPSAMAETSGSRVPRATRSQGGGGGGEIALLATSIMEGGPLLRAKDHVRSSDELVCGIRRAPSPRSFKGRAFASRSVSQTVRDADTVSSGMRTLRMVPRCGDRYRRRASRRAVGLLAPRAWRVARAPATRTPVAVSAPRAWRRGGGRRARRARDGRRCDRDGRARNVSGRPGEIATCPAPWRVSQVPEPLFFVVGPALAAGIFGLSRLR